MPSVPESLPVSGRARGDNAGSALPATRTDIRAHAVRQNVLAPRLDVSAFGRVGRSGGLDPMAVVSGLGGR